MYYAFVEFTILARSDVVKACNQQGPADVKSFLTLACLHICLSLLNYKSMVGHSHDTERTLTVLYRVR